MCKFSVRSHPPGGDGGTRQCGAPNDPTNIATTAAANGSHDGRNNEDEEINVIEEEVQQNNTCNQQTNIIFNYSSLKLTKAMENLLNRALNFSVLPLKLDITQLLVDFNRFSRMAIWQEYWYGREQDKEYIKPIFKTQKRNLPKNYSTPVGLKTCLNAIKSDIMDPKNRNNEKCNLPQEEILALKELIRLQKDRVIIIKAADKGAGIVILNFNDYVKSCYDHLLSSLPDQTTDKN